MTPSVRSFRVAGLTSYQRTAETVLSATVCWVHKEKALPRFRFLARTAWVNRALLVSSFWLAPFWVASGGRVKENGSGMADPRAGMTGKPSAPLVILNSQMLELGSAPRATT